MEFLKNYAALGSLTARTAGFAAVWETAGFPLSIASFSILQLLKAGIMLFRNSIARVGNEN
jgi:hypothetical protein